MNLMNTKDTVTAILRNPKNERSRNSDSVLMANVWSQFFALKKIDLKTTSTHDFLTMFAKGDVPSFESCTRVRRKLQEKHSELRGSNYKERKAEEVKIIEQLNPENWEQLVDELYKK